MTEPGVRIEQFGLGDPRIREFAYLPWRLYRGDPCWTPPLMADLLGNRLLDTKGLLTAEHPYHDEAEVTHFIARRDGRAIGRVSAAVNRRFNDYYGAKLGFFGFFEVEDDHEAATALLDAAKAWIAERGMTAMRGPGEYSTATHERQGVLVEGFEFPPTVELTHNPPYYADLLERYGLRKVQDWVAHTIKVADIDHERLERLATAICKRERIETRPVDMSRFREEVRLIIRIYNEAWAANWGFLPVTEGEADALADSLKPIVDPGLIRFAFVDGEPIAMMGAIPDPNWALRPRWKWYGDSDAVRLARVLIMRRHIPRVRLMFFGIRPEYRRAGVDAVLLHETFKYGAPRGYTEAEPSMLLEDNVMIIRPSVAMGGHEYKRWRIYEMPID
ncbi:MAG TPA: N-acetyltransferase [Coriobacteriia bacterium]